MMTRCASGCCVRGGGGVVLKLELMPRASAERGTHHFPSQDPALNPRVTGQELVSTGQRSIILPQRGCKRSEESGWIRDKHRGKVHWYTLAITPYKTQ